MFRAVLSFRMPWFGMSWWRWHHRAFKTWLRHPTYCKFSMTGRDLGLIVLSFHPRLTVAAMSRISINLRSSVQKMKNVKVVRPVLPKIFTQHSHLDVASNIKIVAPGFNQTKTVDSLDFGLELSTPDLRRDQPNLGTANTSGSSKDATPNRPRLGTILQESSDLEHGSVWLSTRQSHSVGWNTIECGPLVDIWNTPLSSYLFMSLGMRVTIVHLWW